MSINITFSTCWYRLKSKFNKDVYINWIQNMLSNVNNYYLVIYTNLESFQDIAEYSSFKNIKIIIKEYEDFYNYKYKTQWLENQEKSILKGKIDWQLNMLWSEKIHFVTDTISNKYFETDYYGWCDIGYFRNRHNDTLIDQIKYWPSFDKIEALDKTKIHYALVNNNTRYITQLATIIILNKNKESPINPIPQDQISIAGGFFILTKENILWWQDTYDNCLKEYFEKGYVVKDDQMIVIDCVVNNLEKFQLYKEQGEKDNWFMFQRLLL